MKKIETIKDIRNILSPYQVEGLSVGLVPTMGYLHEGHLSLVRQCKKENEITVVSLFVNPTQFGPTEDLERYPRDPERDRLLLEGLEVDFLFAPDVREIYPENYAAYVEIERFSKYLCGQSRPGHFRGVATVVLKLFNIVRPTHAYFGQKDAQQAVIIKKMVQDLNLDIHVRVMPIVRDLDGLALSSRNAYLSREEREAGLSLSRALSRAEKMIETGVTVVPLLKQVMVDELNKSPLIGIDYMEIVSLDQLEPIDTIDLRNTLVAGAIFVGKTRLIDNFILGEI